jgi:hypothetical protein
MGREADCIAKFSWIEGGNPREGRAMLEADELLFRGTPKVVIARGQITRAAAGEGELVVTTAQGTARFELGSAAEKWRDAILSPPSLMEKLSIAKDAHVAVVGELPDAVKAELAARTGNAREGAPVEGTAVVLAVALTPAELTKAAQLAKKIAGATALWIIYPKGKDSPVPEAAVMETMRSAGLKDNKTCRVDDALTGLRFVVPKAAR